MASPRLWLSTDARSVVVIASITGRSAMEFISGKEEKYENLSPIQDCALDGVGATRVASSHNLHEKFWRVSFFMALESSKLDNYNRICNWVVCIAHKPET